MKFSIYPIRSSDIQEFEQVAKRCNSTSGYKWLSSSQIPSAIPESLRETNAYSALLMWERTSSGSVYLVFNGIRLDEKDNALDQEPFGIAVNSTGVNTNGIFIHHGDWHNRTTPITPEVQKILNSTSLGNYFPLGEVPQCSSGSLSDLRNTSHDRAFKNIMDKLSINSNSE